MGAFCKASRRKALHRAYLLQSTRSLRQRSGTGNGAERPASTFETPTSHETAMSLSTAGSGRSSARIDVHPPVAFTRPPPFRTERRADREVRKKPENFRHTAADALGRAQARAAR